MLHRLVGAILDLEDEKLVGACVITFHGEKGTKVTIHGSFEFLAMKKAMGIVTEELKLAGEAEWQGLPIQN